MHSLTRSFISLSLVASFAISPIAQAQSDVRTDFSDVPKDHYAYDAVKYLLSREMISGYKDGTFRPEEEVNRAEAIKIIVAPLVARTATYKKTTFTDVASDAWYLPYVEWARQQKVVSDGTTFSPSNAVKKAEFLKMLLLAYDSDPKAFGNIQLPLANDVTDPKSWDYPFMRLAIAFSLTSASKNGYLSPERNLTRGDVAIFLYRFFQYRAGQQTQALLTETTDEISNVITDLDSNDIQEAQNASIRALLASMGAHESKPDEAVVKVAVKTTEGFRALVRSYQAWQDKDYDQVIKHANDAWYLGDEAKKISPSAEGVANQLQKYAGNFADSARKAKKS